MTPIHPIKVLGRVILEYRDYLRSEFRATDPKLMAALDSELDKPLFLAQEPFYQAHRPFSVSIQACFYHQRGGAGCVRRQTTRRTHWSAALDVENRKVLQ